MTTTAMITTATVCYPLGLRARSCRFAATTAFLLLALAAPAISSDWQQWRGPRGNGIADNAATPQGKLPPVTFSKDENVLWQSAIPGRGHGSPTVVGNRIYLSTADDAKGTQSLLSIDRESGQIVWQEVLMTSQKLPEIHNKNTHASSTVACDGERLFVTLYAQDSVWIHCRTIDGDAVWSRKLAPFRPKYPFGYAASPVLYGELVIATAESEAETALIGLDRKSGKEIWRSPRPQNSSYSSPALLQVGGRQQLVISGGRQITAYDPGTGKQLWSAEGAAKHTAGTVTGEGDYVLASGGYPESETTCIRADGSGRIVWKNNQKSYEQSMIVHDGYVYAFTDKGVAFCWELRSGKEMWKQRLAGPVSSSPVLVGDRIYAGNEKGALFVFLATPDRYVPLAENQLGSDIFPTPTYLDGKIYARVGFQEGQRRREVLFCIGEK